MESLSGSLDPVPANLTWIVSPPILGLVGSPATMDYVFKT